MTIPEALQIGVQHHQAGRFSEAEALYRQILAVQPRHADALHFLGVLAHQVGRHDVAADLIRQAIEVDPNNPVAHSNLGEAFRATGRFDEAATACLRAIELKPDFANAHLNIGNARRDAGQIDEAIAAFRRALQLKPDYPEAHNNLGIALRDRGQLEEAIAACRRALELKPDYAEAWNHLGVALAEQGQLEEAIAAYRHAVKLNAGYPEAYYNLGVVLRRRGQLEEAIAAYRRALELKPGYADGHNNLGVALAEQRQLEAAAAAYRRAVEIKPEFAEAHYNLGITLRDRGQLDDAIAAYRRALEIKPDYPEAHNHLGIALRERGRFDEAVAACHRALKLQPDYPDALNNLGNALADIARRDEAVAAYRRAIELKPDQPEVHNNLGNALRDRRDLDEAIVAYRRALELKPDQPETLSNLGVALKDRGELDEAIAVYRSALQIKPDDAGTHSNLIYALHYHPGHDAGTISEEHQRWNWQFGDPLRPFLQPHANDPSLQRRLRIGYVSPDFRDHPVGRYALPLLEGHDRQRFEILCYSGATRPDWMTERLRALAEWRNTAGIPDARLAEMIRGDGVDILVDLSLHTAGNRLPVFARQPAPVQVSWLAYPGGAGLTGIGYRLTDTCMEPPGEEPAWSVEEPVRLPDCWCCYDPVSESPEINALPALSADGVTFGSLNNFAKVNEGVLALWVRVLEAVKGSRLLMFCPKGRARERVRAFLGERGMAPDRVELAGFLPRWEHLNLYQRIDIGLDPFPYNGMTTTCDALWMGAPVLTLPGKMPISRAGLSILTSIGLEEFAAPSEEDYVRMAVGLAGNLARLADLRATMRARMRASPLMDAPRFARNVEAAYQSMWERWRHRRSAAS
jgi:protein O-GlcNAc transferase